MSINGRIFTIAESSNKTISHFRLRTRVDKQWLGQWIKEVHFTKNPDWNKFLKTLSYRKDLILNFVASGLSNAATEGLINLIRYMRRLSFGITNFERMRLRILASSP